VALTGQATYVARNIEVRSRNGYCSGWAINIKRYECLCILALVTQHAVRMRRIILSSVACLSVPYFSTLPHKWHGFRGKNITEFEMFFLNFTTTLSTKFLILIKNYWGITIDEHKSSCKVSILLARLYWN